MKVRHFKTISFTNIFYSFMDLDNKGCYIVRSNPLTNFVPKQIQEKIHEL